MYLLQCLTHSDAGGAQQVVFSLLTNLRRLCPGLRQTVILPPGGEYATRFPEEGIPVFTLPTDRITTAGILEMRRIIGREQPDIIHSHGKGGRFYSLFARGRGPDVRRVHSFHGFHPPRGAIASTPYYWYERRISGSLDTVVCVSATEEADVLKAVPSLAGRTRVIPNVVDTGLIRDRSQLPLPESLRPIVDGPEDSFIVTMIARPDTVKNYPLAFEIAGRLVRRDDRFRFVFIGISSDDPEYRAIQSLAHDRIVALPSLGEIPSLLRQSDVLMLTSRKEGGPLVILEAFALGIPVIGTRVPGISDYITDGTDGLLCDGDAASFCRCLEMLLADRELHARLSAGAGSRGDALDIREWAAEYLELYRSLSDARC